MLTQVQDLNRKNYQDTLKIQESLREQVLINLSEDYLILVEHEHVYTLGKMLILVIYLTRHVI